MIFAPISRGLYIVLPTNLLKCKNKKITTIKQCIHRYKTRWQQFRIKDLNLIQRPSDAMAFLAPKNFFFFFFFLNGVYSKSMQSILWRLVSNSLGKVKLVQSGPKNINSPLAHMQCFYIEGINSSRTTSTSRTSTLPSIWV